MDKTIDEMILEEGTEFEITVAKKNILHKLHLLPAKRKFKIYPIKLGTLLKISKILLDMDMESLEKLQKSEDVLGDILENIVKNKDKIVKIIAYAIINRNKEPSKRFIKFLDENLSAKEASKLLSLVISKMDVRDFLAMTVQSKGINLLKTKKKPSGGSSEEV